MMSLLNHPRTGCQALENSRKDNLLRRSGLTLFLPLFSWLSIAGCSGIAGQNPPPPSGTGHQSISPTSGAFGEVGVGAASTQTVTFSNAGSGSLTISQAAVSGAGFTTTGQTFPLTLSAGQTSSVNIQFAPTDTSSTTGSVSLLSSATTLATNVALKGAGVKHQLSITPSSVSFGNVAVGNAKTPTATFAKTGTPNLSISQGGRTRAGVRRRAVRISCSPGPTAR